MSDHVKTYTIGDATMKAVFQPSGLTNMHDMQAVMDAVEAALAQRDDALAKADELAGLLHAATTSRAQDDLEWQIDARDTLTAYRQARDATT